MTKPVNPNELLTAEEVAEILKCSPAWVRDHAEPLPGKAARRQPTIKTVRLGTKRKPMLRWRRKDIDAFVELNTFDGTERSM